MEKEIKELKEAVNWIMQQLEIHFDGTPQQAHVDATPLNAGFCTPEIAANARGIGLKDNYLNEKYSFWDIPFGTYSTVYAWDTEVPAPDSVTPGDLITLTVMGEDNRRKSYFMIVQRTGSLWYINTSQNAGSGGGNDNSTVWKRIPQVTTLWQPETDDCSVGTNMNLAVSTRRFRTLIFTIRGLGTLFHVEVPAVDNPVLCFAPVAKVQTSAYQVRIDLAGNDTHKILNFESCRLVEQKADGTCVFSEDAGFTIAGVEGTF
ncbi:hypothetical protein [Enterococcus faecium]|uniref:hypothetical protein n=1 Tax=Enterococcus faecium TaxID=1352 RepID=UPI00215795CD|nr:hypothetical protein [Enterococcus faecium]